MSNCSVCKAFAEQVELDTKNGILRSSMSAPADCRIKTTDGLFIDLCPHQSAAYRSTYHTPVIPTQVNLSVWPYFPKKENPRNFLETIKVLVENNIISAEYADRLMTTNGDP